LTTYLLKRLLLTVPTLIGAYALIFLLTRLVPGDPALLIIEENYTVQSYELVRQKLGLDLPIWQQLWKAAIAALRGDFGDSFSNGRPVTTNIGEQFPHTLQLAAAALAVSVSVGVPIGILAATQRNRWPDQLAMIGSLVALCAPNFWLGVVFIIVFSLHLGWFPAFGVGYSNNLGSLISHLVLPAFVLGLSGAGVLARISRSSMLEVLSQDYVRTARATGFPQLVVVYRYALRNAMIAILTVIGLEAIKHVTGTVVIEVVFARPGVGRALVESILTRDYPQIQVILLFFITLSILINLVIDVSYALVNPQMRYD
jgi:ABC-type dipeptide/oligopeptide/nickel transport system permease component